jgi:hypothetical protein
MAAMGSTYVDDEKMRNMSKKRIPEMSLSEIFTLRR